MSPLIGGMGAEPKFRFRDRPLGSGLITSS